VAPCSSPSSKGIAPYNNKDVPRVLWIPKFLTMFLKSVPLVHILSHRTPVKPLPFHSRNILLILFYVYSSVFVVAIFSSCFPTNTLYAYNALPRNTGHESVYVLYIYIRVSRIYDPLYYIRVWNLGFQMTGHVVMPRNENSRENTNTLVWREVIFWNRIKFRSYPADARTMFLREKGLG